MKIALPIALLIFGLVVLVMLMFRSPWHRRTSADVLADRDKITAAEQQWLSQHPAMKAENSQLEQRHEQTESAKRHASEDEEEAQMEIEAQQEKLKSELIKSDPSLETVYNRLSVDRNYGPVDSGNQQLLTEYGNQGTLFEVRHTSNLLLVTVYPALLIALGIYLLFRPPSWAGAHLFLVLQLLPPIWAAPLLLRIIIWEYLARFSGIFDGPPFAQVLVGSHDILTRIYLRCLPGLLLYVILLFRIHFKERNRRVEA